jgi:CheY-like chemotaxis protein
MSRRTILVVEDELVLREIVGEWLEDEGYAVLPARDGEEALRMAQASPPDVILTDMRMPVMDGLTFLRRLSDVLTRMPPAILVSGFSGKDLRDAYDVGVEISLGKPFTDSQLLAAVKRLTTPPHERWIWREPAKPPQSLQAMFPTPALARQQGTLAFGAGGFCLRTGEPLRVGPVRFSLTFSQAPYSIDGLGTVHWAEPEEEQVGVEISALDPSCVALVRDLVIDPSARGYIPRSSAIQG